MNFIHDFIRDNTEFLDFEQRIALCEKYGKNIASYLKWEDFELKKIIKNHKELISSVCDKFKDNKELITLWIADIEDYEKRENALNWCTMVKALVKDELVILAQSYPDSSMYSSYINTLKLEEISEDILKEFQKVGVENCSYSYGTIHYMSELYNSIIDNYELEMFKKIILNSNNATVDNFLSIYLYPRHAAGKHYICDEVKSGNKDAINFILDLIETPRFAMMRGTLIKFLVSNECKSIPSHYFTRQVLNSLHSEIGTDITELNLGHLSSKEFSKVIGTYRFYAGLSMITVMQMKLKRKKDRANFTSLVEINIDV